MSPRRVDVLVVGGGLAGAIAALAARKAGATVAVASRSYGATALSTGALDLAYAPGPTAVARSRTVAEHLGDIIEHRRRHPFGVIGFAGVVGGLEAGFALLSELLHGSGLEPTPMALDRPNRLVASSLGCVVPAGAVLAPHADIELSALPGAVGVVQLEGHASFAATRLVAGWSHDLGLAPPAAEGPLRVVSTRFAAHEGPMALARRFDDVGAVVALGDELAPRVKGLAGLILPPALGVQHVARNLTLLRERLGLAVAEAVAHEPSVPGLRLHRALHEGLRRAGVASMGEVTHPEVDRGRVVRVSAAGGEVSPGAVVLATGRFVAGGVEWTAGCREALLGLPIVTELGALEADAPHGVVRVSPLESHPLMTAGIRVNATLAPMVEGKVAFDNVFAAGMVLGGFASRYALSADGVALATGAMAGHLAAARSASG